tara:strand:- start:275 stop:3322 length:3048 start_codon:yes stop_codon:yes gene_type:complete
MALFQKSVLNEYLDKQDSIAVEKAYKKFVKYFHNPITQQNIRNINEEGFQQKFLMELFVNCFGYIINPDPYYNLTTEFKNLKDAKKADGAILIDSKAIAVIELKGTDTKDLEKIRQQAFDYKSHHPTCKYVITSNFEKLRFYIDTSDEKEEFNLFTLTENRFAELYLCIFSENILNNIPFEIKKYSSQEEEEITKKLYTDYSHFRKDIFNDLINSNPEYDKLLLFNKTQKLLDRFLFIFFGEDRFLIPANSTGAIINKWEEDKSFYGDRTLFEVFKGYFNVLNVGRPARGEKQAIFAYNGGLFAEDEILNKLKIDDNILLKHTKNLSHYNFNDDVSVNILGHIFEHSLSEIEEIQNEIVGIETDKSKSKRKIDGVFYTPSYVTKYMVKSTVGKLCTKKKTELEINEEVYTQHKVRSQKRIDNLNAYRDWLLRLTICDPACGSGAFLIQALNFLINEHKYIDELNAAYHGASIPFPNITSSILENNLYGVDINEESVEIAKLSLWLRTAKPGRKLTSLNNNLKCGNSLIDDPEIAGDKAFNWQNEFPEVFANGGFDIVIGNPPYVFTRTGEFMEESKNYILDYVLENSISTTSKGLNIQKGKINLFAIFIIKSIEILNKKGYQSFIIPNNILRATPYEAIRKFLLEKSTIEEIVDLGKGVFSDATVSTVIMSHSHFRKNTKINIIKSVEDFVSKKYENSQVPQSYFLKNAQYVLNILANAEDIEIINKIEKVESKLGDFFKFISPGIDGDKKKYVSKSKLNDRYKPLLYGKSFTRYRIRHTNDYILYDRELLNRARKEEIYLSNKIIIQRISGGLMPLRGTIDRNKYYTFNSVNNLVPKNEYKDYLSFFLALINSKLINWYYAIKFSNRSNLTVNISKTFLEIIPLKLSTDLFLLNNVKTFVDHQLELNKDFQKVISSPIKFIETKFEAIKNNRKINDWYKLDFKEFLFELNKNSISLEINEEAGWMQYFNEQKLKAEQLKNEIDKTDNEIDQMVYELYGLNKEEIEIVENSIKKK